MDERLFARLAEWLPRSPVVVASVRDTRGATPRKRGSRMLIAAQATDFSIGGGAAEARVIEAAKALLRSADARAEVQIDLSGRAGAQGICGGAMHVRLRRWEPADHARVVRIVDTLSKGLAITLLPAELGDSEGDEELVRPDPRLLVVGAGHCGQALCELARPLDFERWVFDPRVEAVPGADYAGATRTSGDWAELTQACATQRDLYVVLLNRDFASDVAALRVVTRHPLAFLGMMGSRRRIGEVLAALGPERDAIPAQLRAPVGLDIGAHTPHEIAVSILAQLIQARATPAPV